MPIGNPVDFAFCTEESQPIPDDRRLCNKIPCPEFQPAEFEPVQKYMHTHTHTNT